MFVCMHHSLLACLSAPPLFDMRSFAELYPIVKHKLEIHHGSHRFVHTLGVINVAEELAKIYDVDIEKAKIAALLHDATKHDDLDNQERNIIRYFGENILKSWPKQLYHGFSAVVYAEEELGIDDPMILAAIKNHSVGRPAMSLLEKIIFVADYLEPTRGLHTENIMEVARHNIDKAVAIIAKSSLKYVSDMGYEVVPLSWQTKVYYEKYLEDNE